MSIKQNGGVFGRNPTFNDVTIDGDLIINGEVFTGLDFQGSWNASTNSPSLVSSTGTNGEFYIVSVAGTTDLNGITNWGIGDWAIFNGTVWQRVEGGADGNFDNLTALGTSTLTGNVQIVTGDLTIQSAGTIQLTQNTTASGDLIGRIEFHDEDAGTGDGGVVRLEAIRGSDKDAPDFQIISSDNAGVLTNRLFLDSGTGDITIGTGNLVINTSGKGIDFSATAGTGTSELLDDYEEGTFTPVMSDGTNNATSSTAAGRYTRVGNRVSFTIQLVLSSKGSVSGNLRITGLPFTSTATGTNNASASVGFGSSLSLTAGTALGGYVANGSSHIVMTAWQNTTGVGILFSSQLTDTSFLMVSGHYDA